MKTQTSVYPTFARNRNILIAIASCLLAACVTVNVNFPESAVQKATDDYVKELYRTKEKNKAPAATETKKSAFDLLIPAAIAADSFRVDSEKSMEIMGRMKSRIDEVITYKENGTLGESNDGLLVLKNADKTKKLLIKKLETLVQNENKDRAELYKEVVSSNGMTENREIDVRKSFSRSFQNESPAGTWIQDIDGSWAQKK